MKLCDVFNSLQVVQKKMRERESERGIQVKSIWLLLIVVFFNFYIDLKNFKIKVRDKILVGKISLQKMWSPVSAHFLFPRISAFNIFSCLCWYVPPNVQIHADTAISKIAIQF